MKQFASMTEAEAAYLEYLERLAVAQQTGLLHDGIAANRAWRHFLELYLPPSIE